MGRRIPLLYPNVSRDVRTPKARNLPGFGVLGTERSLDLFRDGAREKSIGPLKSCSPAVPGLQPAATASVQERAGSAKL